MSRLAYIIHVWRNYKKKPVFGGCETSPGDINLFSCSTQLSTKFQLLIKTKIPTNEEVSSFKSHRFGIYHANKC